MASTEVQVGVARINGIQGTYTCAISGSSVTDINPSSIAYTQSFKSEEIPSPSGDYIQTMIGSQHRRDITIEMIPAGTTRANADTLLEALAVLRAFTKFTLGGFDLSALNGDWNYQGGGEITMKRDTYVVANIRLAQFETAVSGTFTALAVAS